MRIGILGFGEIGKAIHQLYSKFEAHQIFVKDLNRDDGLDDIDVLNVCIPAIDNFENVVLDAINLTSAKLTIIHSTLRVGTTEKISLRTESHVVHSPVRGIHPNLLDGILTFVKFIGSSKESSSIAASNHFESLGVKSKILSSSRETEIGKLLDTTYYGVCISWHAEMKKMCDAVGADFDEAVSSFNETYNQGYSSLGKNNVIRPVLYPPEGPIGGHCVVPNARILQESFESEGLNMILKYSKKTQ